MLGVGTNRHPAHGIFVAPSMAGLTMLDSSQRATDPEVQLCGPREHAS